MPIKSASIGPRIRNIGLRRVRVADLADATWNHRVHPQTQSDALDGAIDELGFYGFPDVYEAPGGVLMLIDGHLRKERLIAKHGPDAEIEVNVTDFDEAEAKKANLTKDPLAAMAEENAERLDALLRDCETGNEALALMLSDLAHQSDLYQAEDGDGGGELQAREIPHLYQIVIECKDEGEQKKIYDRMKREGRKCRLLTV